MNKSKKLNNNEYIVHLDGDNFFVSCELTRYPHLVNTPVVVGRERGIAVAMNAPAKLLGITRAMPIFKIKKLYKDVTILSSHFEIYSSFSKRIKKIVAKYSDTIEVYSIDEIFFIYKSNSNNIVSEIEKIKEEIYKTLGITVSCGIANTKVLAKLATSINKPNGVAIINNQNTEAVLKKIKIEDVWGIGSRSISSWKRKGFLNAFDLYKLNEFEIEKFNLAVRKLIYEIKGLSNMKIESSKENQKSYQSTESFYSSNERKFLFSEISRHTEILCGRMSKNDVETKSISFFMRTKDKVYMSKTLEFKKAMYESYDIINALESHFKAIYDKSLTYTKTGITFNSIQSRRITKNPTLSLFEDVKIHKDEDKIRQKSIESLKLSIKSKNRSNVLYNSASMYAFKQKTDKQRLLQIEDPYIYRLPLLYLGVAK